MFVLANNFNKYQSIYSIKQQLNLKNHYFSCESRILDDTKCLAYYNIKPNSRIDIVHKSNGGSKTIGYGLKVFLFVLVFLIFYVLLLVGVLPFLSFIVSNIIIKALKIGVEFLRSLTDPNNWINSFLHIIQIVIIPFFQFILEYGGMAAVVFFLTFFCTYKLYYFKNTAKENTVENQCAAFKATNILAGLTTLMVCGFYFIANLPILISKFITPFIPPPFKGPIKQAVVKLGDLRAKILGSFGPMGLAEEGFIYGMQLLFQNANKVKDIDSQLLYNWTKTYQMTKMYPMNEYIQEAKLKELLSYVNFAELNQKEQFDPEKGCLTQRQGAYGYLLRSFYDNSLYFFLKMVGLLDICGDQQPYIEDLMEQKSRLENMQKTIQSVINDKSVTKNKNSNRKSVEELGKQIASMQELITKAKGTKLLNVPCLVNILTNGALFSIIIMILFTILFIVFFFVKF